MKKINIIISITFLILFFLGVNQNTYANEVVLSLDTNTIQKEDEFKLYVDTDNLSVAALTMRIYYDSSVIEYIGENENVNKLQNQIVYTWTDKSGGEQSKTTGRIVELDFKAKEEANSAISITGEFYNSNGQEIKMNFQNTKIKIKQDEKIENKIENNIENNIENSNNNVSSNNAFLKVMRLDKEGIIPQFNKEITDYYITINNTVENLNVIATAENPESTIEIQGNNNLKEGINTIKIIVTSQDKTNKTTYNIHVTKTNDIESANVNLETLAIENATLFPEFNNTITEYKIEIAHDITNLNILAVPERSESKVTIEGNNNLKEGMNTVIIKVLAANKITEKEYIINVYKRNANEDIQNQNENEEKIEKANQIIEEKKEEATIENNNDKQEQKKENIETKEENKKVIISIIIIAILTISFIIFKIIKKKK